MARDKRRTPAENNAKVEKETEIRNMNLTIANLKKNVEFYKSEGCKFADDLKKLETKSCEEEIKMWENKIKTLNGESTND